VIILYNKIEEFQYGVFDSLNDLQFLNISDNKLLDLHQYTFHSLSNLYSLYFDNNNISTLDGYDLLGHLPNLQKISLDHNPWNCKELVKIEQILKVQVYVVPGHSYDVENFRGVSCTNTKQFTSENVSKNVFKDVAQDIEQIINEGVKNSKISNLFNEDAAENIKKTINDGVKNSKIGNFFNEDFEKSKFVQYFDRDYKQSNFFKYLENYKFASVKHEQLNGSKMEKLTALPVAPNESNNKLLVFSIVIQVVMSALLLSIVYFMFNFLKKMRYDKPKHPSQIELC
jgi:Leucine-rich repeat (LRR) protein